MKKRFLVANWKSNKTIDEARNWISEFKMYQVKKNFFENNTIILCAPFTVLAMIKEKIQKKNLPIFLGAQDISPFSEGAYTGEVNASMLKELVTYVIVGHSERRKYFHESDEELAFEVLQAHESGISVIYCVEDAGMEIPQSVDIVGYEPSAAIGSGMSQDPKEAENICRRIKEKIGGKPVLYGGSVSEKNSDLFLEMPSIDGLLVGGASLDPTRFMVLVDHFVKKSH